jgi:hypothetical protein
VCSKHGRHACSMFGWLVADGWFVLREEYCWLVAGGWFVLREEYCWLISQANKLLVSGREVRSGYTRLLQSSMPLAIRRRSVRMRARRAFCWRHQRPSAQQDTEAPGARIMRGDTRCTGYGCRGGAITTCDGDVRDQLLRWL